jgi:hypothetical protein
MCHNYLAILDLLLGNLARADERLPKVLAMAERENDSNLRGFVLVIQGATAALRGDVSAGRSLCDSGLAVLEDVGNRWTQLWALDWAAGVLLLAGDEVQARRFVERTLRLTLESGAYESLPRTLGFAATLAASDRRYGAAAQIWGAAESIASKTGVAPDLRTAFRAAEEPQRRKTAHALDDATLRKEEAEGCAMSIEHAITLALEQVGES